MSDTEIVNYALLSKLGGAGDQSNASGVISDIDDPNDPVAKKCKIMFPFCRQRLITDLAIARCPAKETLKFADLGNQADTGSLETGDWSYAFNIPKNCLAVIRQVDEDFDNDYDRQEYRFEEILNANNNGRILLTNDLCNSALDSVFIEYVIDQTNSGLFSPPFKNALAALLAAEIAPMCGKDLKTRQALLVEYNSISLPNCMSFNQSQMNNYAEKKPFFFGGRGEISEV
ncbi:MAG: hypothetical protein PHQ00_00025 [Phycisphaerae bacterium]|nr:hypothetical protein [Phycisphaerae bacterium]